MIRLQYLGDQTDLLTFYSSVTALRKLDSLVVENEQSYLQTTQLLLCPVSNNSLPTLEISDIVMNSNKDVGK